MLMTFIYLSSAYLPSWDSPRRNTLKSDPGVAIFIILKQPQSRM